MAQKITAISVYTNGGWSTPVPISAGDIHEASEVVAGILKAYNTTGSNTDGTMTQSAITTAINNAKNTIATASSISAGVTKIYNTTGSNTDGTMTQSAITQSLESDETIEISENWPNTTTSVSLNGAEGGTYYSKSVTMTEQHGNHPIIMLIPGGDNTIPTTAQIEAFNSIDFIVTNGTALTLYSKVKINTPFAIYVKG